MPNTHTHSQPLSVLPDLFLGKWPLPKLGLKQRGKIEKGLQPRKSYPRHMLLHIKSLSLLGHSFKDHWNDSLTWEVACMSSKARAWGIEYHRIEISSCSCLSVNDEMSIETIDYTDLYCISNAFFLNIYRCVVIIIIFLNGWSPSRISCFVCNAFAKLSGYKICRCQ